MNTGWMPVEQMPVGKSCFIGSDSIPKNELWIAYRAASGDLATVYCWETMLHNAFASPHVCQMHLTTIFELRTSEPPFFFVEFPEFRAVKVKP